MFKHQPPFFVVGLPRSGTKLLRELLNQSEAVWIPDVESQFISRYGQRLERYGDLSQWSSFEEMARDVSGSVAFHHWSRRDVTVDLREWFDRTIVYDWAGIVSALFALLYEHSSDHDDRPWEQIYWGDKSPQYITELPTLSRLFPRARFIHIVRDPRDVAMSVERTWSQHPLRAAQRWSDSVAACHTAGVALGADRYTEVRYEDLLQDPVLETTRLCDFLGVEVPDQVGTLAHSVESDGNTEVRSDNSRKWERQMAPALQRGIEGLTGRWLEHYGYPRIFPQVRGKRLNPLRAGVYTLQDGWRTLLMRRQAFRSWRRVLQSLRS